MDNTERLLIEKCKQGDRRAFDMLIQGYEKRVYNLAYRLSGHYDEANDISVDAFIRVFQALKLFRGELEFLNVAVSHRHECLSGSPQAFAQQTASFARRVH